ncbi:MAG: hypothetical protein KDI79_31905 [Anaerolineae bacterium]|nr:hypothetical protein [Anaerolineae bacterium]
MSVYLLQPISPKFIWFFWLTLVILLWLGLIWLGSALEILIDRWGRTIVELAAE